MILECKQLFNIIGEITSIDYSLDLSDYELFFSHPFKTPVHIKGSAQNAAGIVTLSYSTDFTLSLNCDRCASPFSQDFHYSFKQTLVSSLETDNDEYILVEKNKLDLDELVLSDILLNLPSKLLCSRDCKGLCQKCGANLNQTTCLCKASEIDSRLSVLSTLL